MPRHLILFGAGASYGSDNNTSLPPLGADLFDELARFNPDGWGQLNADSSNKFRNDFEAGMVALSQIRPHALPPLQRAMAAYFFNFTPRSSSLYYSLANKIADIDWDGALITLNYERLLEISLSAANVQPYIGPPPTSSKKIVELCLPHGCCHLFCESVRGNGVSFAGMNVTTNGPIKVISDQTEFRQRIINEAFPPVMSYFEPTKQTTSGNNFIVNQRARYAELVAQASVIVLVGIQVREHDTHIWQPLKNTSANLIYVAGPTAKKRFEKWHKSRKNNHDNALGGYFEESYNSILKYVRLQ